MAHRLPDKRPVLFKEASELKTPFTILIADRNSHVREFLRREMASEGFQVRLAQNGTEVLKWIYHHEHVDLLILDPDFPDSEKSELIKKLSDRIPSLPVIIHTFPSEEELDYSALKKAVFVEKGGSSVEDLKQMVLKLLGGR
jgi:DNA-binding NtrC family response regulator